MKKVKILITLIFTVLSMLFTGCELQQEEPKVSEFTVYFYPNGGMGEMEEQTIMSGDSINLTTNTFTREGYTFVGWATALNGDVVFPDGFNYTMGNSNLALYAIWEINSSYIITFNGNTNTGGTTNSQSLIEGLPTNLNANGFNKTGYTFAGWSTTYNGSVTYSDEVSYIIGNSNITLYAVWIINNSNIITYNGNSSTGGATASQSLVEGLPTKLNVNGFTKTGYTFAGWSTTPNGSVTYLDEAIYTIGISNITLYAVWITNDSHTIIFNGNTNTGGVTVSQILVEGLPTKLNANGFTKTGYTFIGWSTTSNGAVTYLDEASYSIGTSNVTLYAKWTINDSYTITFNGNTNTGGATAPQSLVEGLPTNLNINGFTKIGYYFAGWSTTPNGSLIYSNKSRYVIGKSNITLFAVWRINASRRITFDGNTNTGGTTASQLIVEGLSDNLNSNGFTKTGYTFAGWSTTSNGSVSYIDESSYTMGSSSIRLYAKWTINDSHTITFNGNTNTGGATASQSLVEGLPTKLNANDFTKPGYTFLGWSTIETGSVEYTNEIELTIGKSDMTLYAVWELNPTYTLTFDGNGSTGGTTASQEFIEGLPTSITPNGFTREGFTFVGWTYSSSVWDSVKYRDEELYTIGSRNRTLYAKWSRTIGSSYAGGIVFYVDETGISGLVCANRDQSSSIQWGPNTQVGIYTYIGTSYGDGKKNTSDIVAAIGDGVYAAKVCDDLVLNGYSDWYLPSRFELGRMGILRDFGAFADGYYWSSSESSRNGNQNVSIYSINSNSSYDGQHKSDTYRVRAVRAF